MNTKVEPGEFDIAAGNPSSGCELQKALPTVTPSSNQPRKNP
jgi:hypothetical protein